MNKLCYELIEYIRQLNYYFIDTFDYGDVELNIYVGIAYFTQPFTIESSTDCHKYMFTIDDFCEICDVNGSPLTLNELLVNIYQFALNHTDNYDIKHNSNNNVPHVIFERAKKYLSHLFL